MSVTAERLMVEVQADVRDALRKLDSLEKRNTTVMSRMGKMARSMGLAFGGAAVVSGISKTINLAMTFDKTMRQVGVQTDQSGKKLENLGKLALKMGKDTVFSAQDAGSAMLELAKGGLSAAEIRTGALRQTLRLAAAGGLELADAAGYITQGMNTYGLKAKNAVQVTTALAGGANASTASVGSLGLALSQVGPGAVNAGMSIQETVAALAAFANKGIQGSDAGTSLKTMFASLVPNTIKAKNAMKKYNLDFVKQNGDFKTMAQVAQELKDGLGDLSQSQRSAALRTIFGSDATRAATVLMKEGEKGVRKYIAATKDRKKTQEMADAAMKGASGAWENFKGSVETAAIQLGTKLLPSFTKAANAGGDLVDEAMTWGPAIEESFGWTATLAKGLVSALKPVASLIGTLAGAWEKLPGPVKETATQVLVASLLFPRLAAAASSASARVVGGFTMMSAKAKQYAAEMTYAETRTQRLGQAARTAAGIGGMVLLAKGADKAGTSMGTMATTAGAALTGFSVAGPIGGALGAGAGLLYSLKAAQDAANDSFVASLQFQKDYRDSLNQTNAAITEQTRRTAYSNLQANGALGVTRALGIADRDAVGYLMGKKDAVERVTAAVTKATGSAKQLRGANSDAFYFNKQSAGDFLNALTLGHKSLTAEQRALMRQIEAAKSWGKALKGVPKEVITKLKADGYKESYNGLRKLVDTYKMTPEQVETVVKALGIDLTKDQMAELIREGKKLGDMKPTPRVDADTRQADGKLANTRRRLQELGGSRAFPSADLNDKVSPAISGVEARLRALDGKSATVTTIMKTVTQTVKGIGKSFGDGFAGGGYTGGQSAREAVGLVHGKEYVMDAVTTSRARPLLEAIHAAKGRVWGYASGGAVGEKPGAPKLTDAQRKAQAAAASRKADARDFVKGVVKGVREGLREMRDTFHHLDKTVTRNMSGKEQERWLKKSASTQARLEGIYARQAKVTKRLADAQEKLSNLRQTKSNFVGTVREGMASQATVLNAGNTAGAIRTSLGVQAAKVKRFAAMLRKLRALKFSGAVIRQIASAGIEGGYAAAEALVKATPQERAGINADFATITKTAGSTAKALGAQMYDAGIRGAQGMVDQIKKRKKAIEDTIMAIAVAMRDALRKALGLDQGQGKGGGANASARTMTGAPTSTYASTKGLTVDSVQGGLRAGSSVTFNFVTHNPQAEPQSQTANKALAKVASLSLV